LREYFRDVAKDPFYNKTLYHAIKNDLTNPKSWLRRQRKNANYHWKKNKKLATLGIDGKDEDTDRKILMNAKSDENKELEKPSIKNEKIDKSHLE
jgi:RNA polymerase-binding transcription factor DksA